MKKILQLLVLQCFITQIIAQTPVNRKALVIGNAQYPDRPLNNPSNDAHAMTAFLRKNGFNVILGINLNRDEMNDSLRLFRESLLEGDITVFFFAGHGGERDGVNYLYPIPSNEDHLVSRQERLIHLDRFLESLTPKKCLLNMIMLDACRSDPNSTRAIDAGPMPKPNSKTVISFAAASGKRSQDGPVNGLSPYTESFLNIARQDVTLNDLFPQLVDSVLAKTGNQQHPCVHHSMSGDVARFKFLLPKRHFSMVPIPASVAIPTFAIGQHEVTQEEWKTIMGDLPAMNQCLNCPIENVSFIDIQSFITKLNELTGKKYRLCSETEWDYAAHGGNNTPIYRYSGSDDLNEVGWYAANASKTHPVGEKKPNKFKIYDMSGNVWEWCRDANGKGVLRGGSLGQERDSRLRSRLPAPPEWKSQYYGFRLCQDL